MINIHADWLQTLQNVLAVTNRHINGLTSLYSGVMLGRTH